MRLFKSKQKTEEKFKITCKAGDPGSYKCIFLASYRKLPVDVKWEEPTIFEDKMSESLHMSGLRRFPCLEDGDFTVCGSYPVLTYLNIKGQSPTIHPRKARVLAMQQYWIQVLVEKFEPLVAVITNQPNSAKEVLEVFDNNLLNKKYIVDEFSLADIHWAAIFKVLEGQDQSDLFSSYSNIKNWLARMKAEIPDYMVEHEKVTA